jgi:hypothetical protein
MAANLLTKYMDVVDTQESRRRQSRWNASDGEAGYGRTTVVA